MLTATHSDTTGAVAWRYSGKSYDSVRIHFVRAVDGNVVVVVGLPGGGTGNESTKQSGKKTLWTGVVYDAASDKTIRIRDTFTVVSSTTFTDLGELESGGAMKPDYDGTCTRRWARDRAAGVNIYW